MPTALARQLAGLPPEVQERLRAHGFDAAAFCERAARVAAAGVDNVARGEIGPPAPSDVVPLPPRGSAEHARLASVGAAALARGEHALVVLAGGMATRMGGVVKALVEALPGRTFLELRLAEQEAVRARHGRAAPLWLMTSDATDGPIRAALGPRLDGERVAAFVQGLAPRLDERAGLFLGADGAPSLHAPGHGDLPDALRASGLLARFVAGGGRSVTLTNLDNLGATLEPAVIGWHLDQGADVTCELVEKSGTDRGGIPVRWNGRPVVLEELRLPPTLDASSVRVFNTNTFHVGARALLESHVDWTWLVVKKRVGERDALQMERLIGELTCALPTRFLLVPRTGAESRFLPVKDSDELAVRRAEIEQVARDRGMLA
ncbi:MAG: UTP--glucose-1-phosphate uridylyltransferase [Polyangiaceae bacterium]|nr:UTP--glucose-1-phosphate uridylyltransferase [Polyangiaceae bacterium]